MRRFFCVVFAVALSLLVNACGENATVRAVQGDGGAEVIAVTPVSPTHTPVDDFQKGVQIYWHPEGSHGDALEAANRIISYVVGLGANAVGITLPLYANGVEATGVHAGVDTPSPEYLGLVVNEAKVRGLHVKVRLLIDEESLVTAERPDAWRGDLVPVDPMQWFADYADLAAQYVPVLIDHDVEEYVVGVELKGLQAYPEGWQMVIDRMRQAGYQGAVGYAFNWNDWSSGMPFTSFGIDAYPSIDLPDDATTGQLVQEISKWIDGLDPTVQQDIIFQEVGIAALNGSYLRPWEWGNVRLGEPLNLDLQARWFTAMCTAAKLNGVKGIYYWMVDANDKTVLSPQEVSAAPAKSFIGRPAENAIRSCFSN